MYSRDPSPQTPRDNSLHLFPFCTLRSRPPHCHLWVPSPCCYAMLLWRTASSSDRKKCFFGVVLHAQNRMWAPTELQPGPTDTRGHLDRSRPSGAPTRWHLTFSDQGGPAASEANCTPRPLGRSSQSVRGARPLPASVYIFLHLDPAPGPNRNRKLGRCHSARGAGMSDGQIHQWCLKSGAGAGFPGGHLEFGQKPRSD